MSKSYKIFFYASNHQQSGFDLRQAHGDKQYKNEPHQNRKIVSKYD